MGTAPKQLNASVSKNLLDRPFHWLAVILRGRTLALRECVRMIGALFAIKDPDLA
jgi:hypothetical protein